MSTTATPREVATTNLINMTDDVSIEDASIDSLIDAMSVAVHRFDAIDNAEADDLETALDDAWQWIKHDSLATSDQRRAAKALYRKYLLGY